jgi:hypothetical protein
MCIVGFFATFDWRWLLAAVLAGAIGDVIMGIGWTLTTAKYEKLLLLKFISNLI